MIKSSLLQTVFVLVLLQPGFSQSMFTDVTIEAGINHAFRVFQGTFGGGAAVIDFNNDGFEDLFIAGGVGSDAFYKNNGDGTFTNITIEAGLSLNDTLITQGAVSADVNKDGHIDLFVTTLASVSFGNAIPRASDILYLNNGDGTFTDATKAFGFGDLKTFSTGATFGDINADGYPDLFVGNYFDHFTGELDKLNSGVITGEQKPSTDQLYVNIGGKTFVNVSTDFGVEHTGFGFGGTFTDYDNDQDLDLYVVNDFGNRATPNRLYINEYPEQKFTEVSEELKVDFGINAMGTAIGDYNNDGWLDYLITNIAISPFMVNMGPGVPFRERSTALGTGFGFLVVEGSGSVAPVSWGSNFFDFDHDMDLDLFICNGSLNPPGTPNPNLFLENIGEKFENISAISNLNDPGIGRGAVTFDYDNDGDLDLFVVNQRPTENAALVGTLKSKLYRNDASDGNWLKVKLSGINATTRGLGARVEVVLDDIRLIREIDGGSSHESHNTTIAHFGLSNRTVVDTLIVNWIGGGKQTLMDIESNQMIEVVEDTELDIQSPFEEGDIRIYPSYFNQEVTIEYQLPEFIVHSVVVMDEQGKVVAKIVDSDIGFFGKIIWNAPEYLNPGLYFFSVYSDNGRYVTRGFKK